MDVVSFTEAAVFADAVRPVIERRPAESNILASVLDTTIAGSPSPDALWLLITDDDGPVAAAMQTPPHNLFLTPLPADRRAEAADLIATRLLLSPHHLPGVTATTDDATAFAASWRRRTGADHRVGMHERLYRIDAAPHEPAGPGRARQLTEDDVPLVAGWLEAYGVEVATSRSAVPGEQIIRQRLTRGWFLIWDDAAGEPVSLAGLSRPQSGVARIGPVYTPGLNRGRGYGSAVTVAATRMGFELGARHCALYADLANPTSNGIYQRIGYRPVSDALMIDFS